MNSKYLGRTISGWKVTDATRTIGGHAIFTLKRKHGFTIDSMTVRDNELTKLSNDKSIEEELSGKNHEVTMNIRTNRNVVSSSRSFSNLFKKI